MKKLPLFGLCLVFVISLIFTLHAQETTPADSVVQLTAEANELSLVARPDLPELGTFWNVTANGIMTPWPCPPPDLSLPIYGLADGVFLVDATGGQVATEDQQSVADALAGLADAVANLIAKIQEVSFTRGMAMALGMEEELESPLNFSSMMTSLDTNALYLEITQVSNGRADLNLHNGTNQVYAIWSSTNLLAGCQVERELWPTNSTVMPFTVPTLGRDNLFVQAQDWTRVDSNGDGIPDWWVWKYFGELSATATNLDSQGNTLGYDYTNSLDPNVIDFSLRVTNNYVNTSTAGGTVTIRAGVPAFFAVLVNDTNLTTANWQPYTSSNLSFYLGATDGTYQVNIGLRGPSDDAWQSWLPTTFQRVTVAPTLTLTSPAGGTVSVPVIQLQGFANATLRRLTFDVSNATGTVTNQTGYVTGQFYDTNQLAFTTDYFQCYDIPLVTNGVNTLTLHATDLAGNTTTTNFSFILDYSAVTNPPVLNIVWPPDGTRIAGTSFTLQALVDDATATISASFVNPNGDTNRVAALVERNGRVWFKHLPLSSGTNTVTVTAINAAGYTSTTHLQVIGNDVGLTIDPLSQPNQARVTVTGTVGDPTALVTVNGVNASVDEFGNWSASHVPVSPSGAADLQVQVSDSSANLLGVQSSIQLQPVMVGVMSYESISHSDYHNVYNDGYRNDASDDYYVGWSYLAGGAESVHTVQTGLSAEDHDISYNNRIPGGQDAFSNVAQNASVTGTFNNVTPSDDNYGTYDLHVTTRLMIEPSGQAGGTTALYLVMASAAEYSEPDGVYYHAEGDLPLLPEWLQFNGQPSVNSGITNDDGSVSGMALISGPAGANVPLTVTATQFYQNQYYSVQNLQARQVGLTTLESRDRLVHGVIESTGSDIVNVTIKNQPAGEGASAQELGTYYDLFSNNPEGSPQHQTYAGEDDILSDTEVAAMDNGTYNFGDQKVIFVRDASDPKKLHFYTVADDYGNLTVKVEATISSLAYTNSTTHLLNQDVLGDLQGSHFGDVITYLDARIDSPELDVVSFPSTPAPIQQRSLLTKALITYYKVNINQPFALTRGTVEGFWGGMKSDYDGIAGLSSLAGRFTASAAERAAVIKELRSITWSGIKEQMGNGLASFMAQAEQNSALVNFGQADPLVDDFTARVYVDGYAMGFSTEQIVSFSIGAAAAAKIGVTSKAVLLAVKGGQYVVDGVDALSKFKVRAITWLVEASKNNVVTEAVAKTGGAMVKNVAELPTTINGKKVGQIIGEKVESAGALYDELRLIGKPLDDFGVKAHEKLARLLEVDIASTLTEAETRGFLRVYSRLEYGTGDFYDKLPLVFRTESTAGKQRLRTALAAYADPASVPSKDLLTLVYVTKKEVDPAEHPALVAFQQRVEESAPESGQTLRVYEGIAAARYELQTGHTGLRRPTAADIPDDELRKAIDFVDPATPGEFLDMKGPILSNDGNFDPTVTATRIQNLATSAIDKVEKNNGFRSVADGGLNPPIPTTAVVDLFGLTQSEAAGVITEIQSSGLPQSLFVFLGN